MKAVVMFAIGAVVGYCLTYYYAALLGSNDLSAGIIAVVLAPLGAVACGVVSALYARAAAAFAAAAILGYLIIVFGWIFYAQMFDIADREGGKGMVIIFIFAPAVGAVAGLIAAALLTTTRPAGGSGNPPPSIAPQAVPPVSNPSRS